MSDAIDEAQHLEALHRDSSLASAKDQERGPGPIIIDGVACCAECEDPIPLARLKAVPDTGLCVKCQDEREAAPKDEEED